MIINTSITELESKRIEIEQQYRLAVELKQRLEDLYEYSRAQQVSIAGYIENCLANAELLQKSIYEKQCFVSDAKDEIWMLINKNNAQISSLLDKMERTKYSRKE